MCKLIVMITKGGNGYIYFFSEHTDFGGATKIQIYSPYIVVNRTDMQLSVLPTPHSQGAVNSEVAPSKS